MCKRGKKPYIINYAIILWKEGLSIERERDFAEVVPRTISVRCQKLFDGKSLGTIHPQLVEGQIPKKDTDF